MSSDPPDEPRASAIHKLSLAECEELLTTVPIGRVGFIFAAHPVVLPVNYRFVDGQILFKTFDGQKFGAAQAHQPVAFEVDEWDQELRTGWSVLLKGRAETVIEWDQARAADDLDLIPWTDDHEHSPWVRIVPTEITGRRIGLPE